MKKTNFISPKWSDYELLDCGNGRKLERFGSVVLDRPEVAAFRPAVWNSAKWREYTDSKFMQTSPNSGSWSKSVKPWQITYNAQLKFNLSLSQFKHIGVFPEQASNWDFMMSTLGNQDGNCKKALNLFAYTGGASLAAKKAGADIIHVEAFSQLISKAKANMELSQLENIRWVKEDALKFAEKEVKRGRKYDLIIMDPPSWGRGPKGERWKIEKHLDHLLKAASALMNKNGSLIINTYSGISAIDLSERLMATSSPRYIHAGKLIVKATSTAEFSTGTLLRAKY